MRLAWLLAVICVAATASASPRVVVTDFDGPRQLADVTRSVVVGLLDKYDVVSTKRWQSVGWASHPPSWPARAKAAGVDAVIDGWIDLESHTLTVAVTDAQSGRQIDTILVKVSDRGVISAAETAKLAAGLDDLLAWVDPTVPVEPRDPPPAHLPAVVADRSYPRSEPVIEVLLTGGFYDHHQGAVVWADGTVQLFGPTCTRHSTLAPARLATLLDALDDAGIFDARSTPTVCLDGLDVEVDVRRGNRRVAAKSSLCGTRESVTANAYNLVTAALELNPCTEPVGDADGDDD
ncbi:MAG TPA: hypothetical protein VGG28_02570 [Kofleriaceae bacterium]